jgi:hypothetical protein
MKLLIPFTRRHWYRKKRFIMPTGLMTILAIAAIIIGSVLGTRSTVGERTGKILIDFLVVTCVLTRLSIKTD